MGIEIIANDSRGIYIPQHFAETCENWKYDEADRATLLRGPDDEYYLETWDTVLQDATYTDSEGNIWRLWQDGDLFAYCLETMSAQEQMNLFGEYNPPDNVILYWVSDCFACAIEYGDYSGLTADDCTILERFLENEAPSDRHHHWTVETALSDSFRRCDITGEYANCIGLLLVDMEKVKQ